MKKNLFSLLVAGAMVFNLTGTALAVANQEIDLKGTVGFKEDELVHVVSIGIPEDVAWSVDHSTYPNVSSETFEIENSSERATLGVTFVEFQQTNAGEVNMDALTLNFTGDLLEGEIGQDIVGYENGETAYSESMTPGAKWTFGFDGEWDAALPLPEDTLNPEYTMTLNFNVLSYDASGIE